MPQIAPALESRAGPALTGTEIFLSNLCGLSPLRFDLPPPGPRHDPIALPIYGVGEAGERLHPAGQGRFRPSPLAPAPGPAQARHGWQPDVGAEEKVIGDGMRRSAAGSSRKA